MPDKNTEIVFYGWTMTIMLYESNTNWFSIITVTKSKQLELKHERVSNRNDVFRQQGIRSQTLSDRWWSYNPLTGQLIRDAPVA